MAKPKALTPQEIYKQRRERDEKERTAYLPPGLINHGNTCFMNSVLQGLIATRLLDDLVHFTPIPPEIQQTVATPIVSRRSPQLTNGHNLAGPYEQAWVNTMPIGDMFLNVLYKAWDSQALRRRDVLSPKSILATLGQKYDQYLDFAQQDAHEFLRILLDAMRMEEQDIIKKRQPLPPNHKKRRRTTITPSNSQHNPVSGSSSSSRSVDTRGSASVPVPSSSSSSSNDGPSNYNPSGEEAPAPINPDEESLLSFVDMLFGGQLTSILVCQKCKNVSQTYEDFNDISLSIKAEDYLPHNRKRDRFKKIVGRLTAFPGTSSSHGHHASSTKDSRNGKSSSSSSNNNNNKDALRPPVQPSHIVEMQRSSSVPPSPRIERSDHILGPGEDEVTRRRSLDVPTVQKPAESGSGSESPSPDMAAQSSTPVVVVEGSEGGHVPAEIGQGHIGTESGLSEHKHVEFLEPKPDRTEKQEAEQNEEKQASKEKSSGKQKESHNGKEKEKSSKQDDSWAKIGRRISLSVGLGRKGGEKDKEKDKEKEKDKKERERKGRSVDRSGGGLSNQLKEIKEVAMEAADLGMKKLSALESLAKPSGESNQDKDKRSASYGQPPIPSSSSSSNAIAASSSPELHGQKTKPLPTLPIPPPPLPSVPPGSSKPDLLSPQPASVSSHHAQPSNPAPLAFPNVQRSKSPKPPKPSNAEAEYLRRILADVSASPSSNSPFSIFKPPLLHSHSSHHNSRAAFSSSSPPTMSHPTMNSSGGTGQGQQEKSAATWLGMGIRNLSGLEECLRLFTAVEVLDGDNMVGCRRCWKIQNGVYHAKEKQEDSDLEEEEEEDRAPSSEGDGNGNGIKDPNGSSLHKSPHPITIPTATVAVPVQLPTSISTPSVWVYSQDERSDTRSVSSLPTSPVSASQVSLDNSTESGGSQQTSSSAATSEAPPPSNKTDGQGVSDGLLLQQRAGPGGLPIPVISTTSPPETPTTWSSSMEDYSSSQEPSSDRRETNREASYARLTGQGAIANGGINTPASAPAPHPRLTQALYGYNPSTSTGSRDSLVIPQIRSRATKYQKRKSYSDSTTTDNDSSGDESDTSIGTSVSAESNRSSPGPDALAAQGQSQSKPSQAQATTTTASTNANPKKKVPKPPKPVVMRPAYKRYLIATPPPVLVIHLKRFQQTAKTPLVSFSHGFKKLEDYVSFPEYLDLLPFLAPRKEDYGLGRRHGKGGTVKAKAKAKEERCMYRLYAVVVHIGNMLGGHYFAYTALPQSDYSSRPTATAPSAPSVAPSDSTGTKESFKTESASSQSARPSVSEERQWAYISDTTVRLTTLEEVLHAKAYICMYERC